jgi:signal transduction histidine kinase
VTSDSSGIFHFAWTAQNAGEYTVVANFAGTQSYGPSSAETALFINSASSTAAPIQNNVNFSLTYTALIIATAVIIGVATTIAIVLRAHKIKP